MSLPELWLPVHGYESLYEVSNRGRVKSLRSGNLMAQRFDHDGYTLVTLSNCGVKTHKVHRLVARAFIESDNYELKVDHRNRVRNDNRSENLRFVSDSINSMNRTPKKVEVLGVRLRENRKNPWQAYCRIDGKFRSLGHFATCDEAIACRKGFERIFGHGHHS